MRYDGDFQVGIHGSGALMQDIPEIIENWVKTLPENYINQEVKSEADYISSMLREKLKAIPNTEEDTVLKWDRSFFQYCFGGSGFYQSDCQGASPAGNRCWGGNHIFCI